MYLEWYLLNKGKETKTSIYLYNREIETVHPLSLAT